MEHRQAALTPQSIWSEYEQGVRYKQYIGLYETVEKNENFFIGKQWEGVDAPDLDKPVFNILRRICNMFIASIVSDDITATVQPFVYTPEAELTCRAAEREIERAIEYAGAKSKNREMLKNACVDGDGCFYLYFNDSAPTGQAARGRIDIDVVDNTDIVFANAQSPDVQRQRYVLILTRRHVDSVRQMARSYGLSEREISEIRPDSETLLINEPDDAENVSVLLRLYKQDGHVYASLSTPDLFLKRPFDTGLTRYPIAYMNWERVKNSYHGQAAVTELIPNQIFVNKCYAMGMDYVKKLAFPKLIYDADRFPNGFSNRIGEAVEVEGGVDGAILSAFQMPEMGSQVMELVEKTMQYTKEYMGASDATLGNIRPDNASAIVAVQKASNAPLELVKLAFYQFVEDTVRSMLDIMAASYGVRTVSVEQNGQHENVVFDFSVLRDMALNLQVNVGASAYWSEIMQVQTADNLFEKGVITDPEVYLSTIPDAYVKNKQRIVESIRQMRDTAAAPASTGELPPV